MITFIKDSVRELKHVVWPTPEETRKYFIMVLTALILFTIYLAVANLVFFDGLLWIKDLINK